MSGPDFWINTLACIRYAKAHMPAFPGIWYPRYIVAIDGNFRSIDDQGAIVTHRIPGIYGQIDHDLFKTVLVRINIW